MINLSTYIIENLENDILENLYTLYHRPKPIKFNFRLGSHGHAAERDTERLISTGEVLELFKDCWSRIKSYIENGKILINQRNSNKPGSSFSLHSSEKTKTGYLTIVCFIKSYNSIKKYYDVELVTTYKGKTIDSWKIGDGTGKTMYHPEKGQVDIWDNFAIAHFDKKDEI